MKNIIKCKNIKCKTKYTVNSQEVLVYRNLDRTEIALYLHCSECDRHQIKIIKYDEGEITLENLKFYEVESFIHNLALQGYEVINSEEIVIEEEIKETVPITSPRSLCYFSSRDGITANQYTLRGDNKVGAGIKSPITYSQLF